LAEEIGALAPYMRALASAASSSDFVGALPDVGTVKQGGFALIDEISKGKTVPQCCICCAPARLPTITRCMHLACARCVVTWFHAAPMHGAAAAAGGAPCPLCRKPFQIEELIRLLPNEEAFHDKDAREGEKTRPAGEVAERVDVKGKGAKKRRRETPDDRSKRRSRQKRKDAKPRREPKKNRLGSARRRPPRRSRGCLCLPARTQTTTATGGTPRCPWTAAVSSRTCTARARGVARRSPRSWRTCVRTSRNQAPRAKPWFSRS
jgi:hypothetical protein